MPYVEGVNTALLNEDGKQDLREWSVLNKSNHTMLTIWDKFTHVERQLIVDWLTEYDRPMTMGGLAFVKLKDVWGMLWRIAATHKDRDKTYLHIRNTIVKEAKRKADRKRR